MKNILSTNKNKLIIAATSIVIALSLRAYAIVSNDTTVETKADNKVNDEVVAGVTSNLLPKHFEKSNLVEVNGIDMVSETMEEAEDKIDEAVEKEVEEASNNSDASFFIGKLMANVDESLNVRKKPSEKAEVVGLMYKGSIATILSNEGEWVKIEANNVKGYVKAEYCVMGSDCEKLAKKSGCYYAVATTDGLRIRTKAKESAGIAHVLAKKEKVRLSFKGKEVEGWTAVKYDGDICYVSSEYVKTKKVFNKAKTMKEINDEIIAEKKKAEREAAKKAAGTTTRAAVDSNVDDVTLLAALIYCEAGGSSYEGQLAVGAVVCNRVRSGRYPNTIRGVIYQRGQFGPAHSGKLSRAIANHSATSTSRRAAEAALAGSDNTGGALHFRSRNSGHSGTVIGANVFF